MSGKNILLRALKGWVAGVVATVPMTVFLKVGHRLLPRRQQYALPPREIVDELLDTAEIGGALNEKEHQGLALVAHFGYGAMTGALYPIVRPLLPRSPVAAGASYGLAIWAFSYLGMLPALRILKPATQHPPARNGLMIAAHLVWGAALGLATAAADRTGSPSS